MDELGVNVHNLKLMGKSYPPSVHIVITFPEAESPPPARPPAEAIIARVAEETGITVERISSSTREAAVVEARDKVIWILWNELYLTTTEIGRLLNRDHSTVVASLRRTRSAAEKSGR